MIKPVVSIASIFALTGRVSNEPINAKWQCAFD